MKKHILPVLFFVLLLAGLQAQPKIQLVNFGPAGFNRPVDIAHCGDSRIFIVEQRGKIWILDSLGNKLPQAFLEIDARVNDTGNEQGLLGLAFHPNYAVNNYFYVHYTQNNGSTKVSRFTRDSLNTNKADPNSEKIILEQAQPFTNHNGGSLKFGSDGYMYIGLGDGGSAGDPQRNGQKKNTFLSKILRVDVDGGDPYAVPSTNPFVNDADYKPEIWTTGLRNPWRISFDRLTGDLWIGDVGQNAREEVDFQPAGVGGYNFGWNCFEGNNVYSTTNCLGANNYDKPAAEYNNPSIGCSITGGFVYRGSRYADLYGFYLYADYCSGRIWGLKQNADGSFPAAVQLVNLGDFEFSSFGEGKDGELYVALLSSGRIQKITELCSPFQISGTSIAETCAGDANGSIDLNISNPTGNTSITWSNGANTEDLSNLTGGIYTVLVKDGNSCERRDTFEIANQSPAPPNVFGLNILACEGIPVTLRIPEAPMGYGYQWYQNGEILPNATADSLVVAANGSFQALYTGTPCPSALSGTQTVSFQPIPAPEISVSQDTLFSSEVGFGIQWFLNGDSIQNAHDPFYVFSESGTYSVSVFNGTCTGISAPLAVVGTKMPSSVEFFQLSPNPAASFVKIDLNLTSVQQVLLQVSDANNKTVLEEALNGKSINKRLELGNMPAGTYFLTVRIGQEGFRRKLVKI